MSGAAVAGNFQNYGYSMPNPLDGTDGKQCSDNEWKTFNDYFVNASLMGTIFKNMFYDPQPPFVGYGGFGSIDLIGTPA